MSSAYLISIVVCTFNRSRFLKTCIESLLTQTVDKSRFEIIIINNNSSDDTQEIANRFASKFSNIRIIIEQKQGLSHARNRGWKEAIGEFVAYIDDDAKAAPDWLEKILAAFKSVEPSPVAVGGQILPWYETIPPTWFIDDFEIRSWGGRPGFLQPPKAQSGFSGSNMAFKREDLIRLGGFSSNFGMIGKKIRMGEESELFMRLYKDSPWFWYDPEIKVEHWVSKRNMQISYRFWRAFRSGEAYAQRLGREFFSISYLKSIASLLLFIIMSPLFVFSGNDGVRTEFVKRIQELGNRLGYLFSSM